MPSILLIVVIMFTDNVIETICFFFNCCSLVYMKYGWLCMHFWKGPYLGWWLLLLLLLLLWTLLVGDGLHMLRMHMMVRVEGLWRRVKPLQGPEGTWDEFWGQWVENVGLLELQGLQLCLYLLKGDAMKAWVFMADGDKVLPEFSEKKKKRKTRWRVLLMFSCSMSHCLDWVFLIAGCWINNSRGAEYKDQVCLKQLRKMYKKEKKWERKISKNTKHAKRKENLN